MKKQLGQVFTPQYIVRNIIDLTEYNKNCINKKILEPSFGEGVFLIEIIITLIKKCKELGYNTFQIKEQIENNIYGIEIDENLYNTTKNNINKLLNDFGLINVNVNLYNMNTLDFNDNIKFDYILGNPPYVRIHNIDDKTKSKLKKYQFAKGNTDLYIIFFELCINKLNKNGKIGFITPNSFLKNSSQKTFRDYLIEKKLITNLIDYKSKKIFNNVDTYAAITILQNNNTSNSLSYSFYNKNELTKNIDIKYKDLLNTEWTFNENIGTKILKDICNVQHGISTNADKIYIGNIIEKSENTIIFNNYEIEKDILIKIVKGSRYKGEDITLRLLFPYIFKNGKYIIMDENFLKTKYPLAYQYLLDNKDKLIKRDLEKNAKWYQFARSQGLNTINEEKIVIKHIISDTDEKIVFHKLQKNIAVYSGIYITSTNLDKVTNIINTSNFCNYCKTSGKDMAGNYKSISAKIVKEYKYN